jgi:hypothetical protein
VQTQRWTTVTLATVVDGLNVHVHVPEDVGAVDQIRYAWQDINECILVDSVGLPLAPFNVQL